MRRYGLEHRGHCDRRSVRVRLTDKGRHLREIVARLLATHAEGLTAHAVLDPAALEEITRSLKRMERY